MKITDISIRKLKPIGPFLVSAGLPEIFFPQVLMTVATDEGVEGQFICWLPDEYAGEIPKFRAMLKGKDPHYVEQITQSLTRKYTMPTAANSALDICLWDAIGKFHGVPLYKLFGACRDRMPAYVSTMCNKSVEAYVEEALRYRKMGFKGFKIHGMAGPEEDIEVCRAVRKAVPDMMLSLDPVNNYDRPGAIKVGRALEELGFEWYESPIPDDDLEGLRWLRQKLDIPMSAGEAIRDAVRRLPQYLADRPVDIFRTIGDWSGGISGMRKMANICEGFAVQFDPHSYGVTTAQAAHFHVMLSCPVSTWLELPIPPAEWEKGMKDVLRIDEQGYVHASAKPGLGYEIDMDVIENLTVEVY